MAKERKDRVVVSFKSTEEDQKLYDEICKNSDKSAYVKDRLRSYLENTSESEEFQKKYYAILDENRELLKKYNNLLEVHNEFVTMLHDHSKQVTSTNFNVKKESNLDNNKVENNVRKVESPKPKIIEEPIKPKEVVVEVKEQPKTEIKNIPDERVVTKEVSKEKTTSTRRRAPRLNSHDY